MKKIVIMKGNFSEFDYDYKWRPLTEEYFEVDEDTYRRISSYIKSPYNYDKYRMFDYVCSETVVYKNLLDEIEQEEKRVQREREEYENRKVAEAAKRAEKSAERKRKQLEKLKKEFGEA